MIDCKIEEMNSGLSDVLTILLLSEIYFRDHFYSCVDL